MNLSEVIELYTSVLEVNKKNISEYLSEHGNSFDYSLGFQRGVICGYEHLLNDLKELDK
ncbi:MAG: hypothetical protein ACLTKT_00510 [Clostridia bacterium]